LHEFKNAKRIVVKVGTSTLTYESGLINIRRLERLVTVLSDLANSGLEIVLVSSGAIAVGVGKLGMRSRPSEIALRQAAASVGQCELMHLYDRYFSQFHHKVAQLLLTRDVVDDPNRRQNTVNTFGALFELGAIPIVNENDTVSTAELEGGDSFGDNDRLSSLVATLIDADGLIILSDINGLYTANPTTNPDATLIPWVEKIDDALMACATGSGTNRGTGGMATKLQAAKLVTGKGIPMAIVNGKDPENLYWVLEGRPVGTVFIGQRS